MAERKESADTGRLKALYAEQLQEAYWLEKKLVRTLLKFQEIATASNVKQLFADHSEQTKTHVSRLELLFNLINIPINTRTCPTISNIADSYSGIVTDTKSDVSKRDVRLILAAQKAEYYEISMYTGLIELSDLLQYKDAEPILCKTLHEEQQANEMFLCIIKKIVDYKV